MQTCTNCQQLNNDSDRYCQNCGVDLLEYSNHAVALKNLQSDPAVSGVRISVYDDACPVCQQARGSYPLDQVPQLPIQGCSHPQGCRCHYEPWLKEIHP